MKTHFESRSWISLAALTWACLSSGSTVLADLAQPSAEKIQNLESVTLDDQIRIGYGLAVGDVNGDQKPDIVLADAREIVWYENPTWKKHVIAKNLTLQDHVCVAVQDLDGDGKVEIGVGANWNPGETSDDTKSGSVHFLFRGEDGSTWSSVRLPNEPTVHRMRWMKDGEGKWALVVAPLHGRGNQNGDGVNGVKIEAYYPPASSQEWGNSSSWKRELVFNEFHITHNFDDDGTQWILGGKEGIIMGSIEEKTSGWVLDRLLPNEKLKETADNAQKFLGVGEIRLIHNAENKEDGFASIEPFHGPQVVWYQKKADHYARHVLDSSLNQGHALATGDFLGLGSSQIIAGWRNPDREGKVGIRIYHRNQEGAWVSQWIDENGMACEDLKLVDLDGDSHPELIAAGRATRNVKIYRLKR